MFAVPGWAISASSLVQEKPKSKNTKTDSNQDNPAAKPKKRKRAAEDHDETGSRESAGGGIHPRRGVSSGGGDSTNVNAVAKAQENRLDTLKAEKIEHQTAEIRRSAYSSKPRVKERAGTISKHGVEQNVRNQQPREESHSVARSQDAFKNRAVTTEQLLPASVAKLTPLQAKMRSKLTSARFRHLNETLYTTSSTEALQLFTSSPELFADYHAGFAQQVKDSWPQNPVDEYIRSVKVRGTTFESKGGSVPLPRRKTGSCTIADLGCGDAPLARGCQSVTGKLKLKFHNYDLHAANTLVTKADISNLPLRDGEADIAVFCLSLMGTNWIAFVEEAWRILRGDGKGEIWVAEVKSRFGRVTKGRVVENSVGKRRKKPKTNQKEDEYDDPEKFAEDERGSAEPEDETDIAAFIKVFTRRGFQLRENSVNNRNKMFVSMSFIKSGIPTAGKHKGLKWTGREYQKQHDVKMRFSGGRKDEEEMSVEQEAKALKPCVYKTR